MNTRKENRLVVVNSDDGQKFCELWNVVIKESIQDNGKTLKIFVGEK